MKMYAIFTSCRDVFQKQFSDNLERGITFIDIKNKI
jgi:hypothetical protein